MRIVHCCLANFYIDESSYQENILAKTHKFHGHDVHVLASTESFNYRLETDYLAASDYITSDGIPITRLPYLKWLPAPLMHKVRWYPGVVEYLERVKPDLIFVHGVQFLSTRAIVAYKKKHPSVRIVADSHTDDINSGRSFFSKYFLHKLFYRYCVQQLVPVTETFYGVLPSRVVFLQEEYGVPKEKTDLLVMGADHLAIDLEKRDEIRMTIRSKMGFSDDDIVIVTGGKLRPSKGIGSVVKAVANMPDKRFRLMVFGKPIPSYREEYEEMVKNYDFINLGWLSNEEMYPILLAADLAVFPGTHSVLWEQAIGVGLPCLFRKWKLVNHVDLNGNCGFLNSGEPDEITEWLHFLLNNPDELLKMREVSLDRGVKDFSYLKIAEDALKVK
jgi:glycosyltransferase involved in cell wall biosynthesis